MKKIFFLTAVFVLFFSCDKNTTVNNNTFIPNYSFSVDVNLSLPTYNNLNFSGNAIIINNQGAGVRGVIIFNTGSGFLAYDAACPNQQLSDCSKMTLAGISANCPCDNKKYSLYTGLANGANFPLKAYRVSKNGDIVNISN